MKPSGYDSCFDAIMKTKLENPVVYGGMIMYFESNKLYDVRCMYGYDLYIECLGDAIKQLGGFQYA